MRFLFLGSLFVASLAFGQGRDVNARCRRPCTTHVTDSRQRASLCGLCGVDAEPMGWLFKVSSVPASALLDDDWLVRWTAVRADAKKTNTTNEARLAKWVDESGEEPRRLACLTAGYAAGSQQKRRSEFFAAEPKAERACAALDSGIAELERRDVLAAQRNLALEALTFLSVGRGVGPARLILDVVPCQPLESDEQLAGLLVALAERGTPPVGITLLRDAKTEDAKAIDRLLAVYSRERDRQRPLLSSKDKDARRQAITALAPLAPLSASELTTGLHDSQASIRMASAQALARGEARSVTDAARARLAGDVPSSASEKRQWLMLLADVDDPACVTLTRGVWRDSTQPDVVRAEALVSLAGCGRRAAVDDLVAAAKETSPTLQAGVMRASLLLPREPRVAPLVEQALSSQADEVLVAAAQAVAAHRLTPLKARLTPLVDHPSPDVRVEVLRALWMLDGRATQGLVVRRLETDPDASVRSAAAELLPELGGPLAVSALARASKRDPDSRVKMAALDGLRRLGITP